MLKNTKRLAPVPALVILLISCTPGDPVPGPLQELYPYPPLVAQGQPSPYPPPSARPTLRPADSQELVSGICDEAVDEIVEILLTPDGPASPRCVRVGPEQRLVFINGRDDTVLLVFGPFSESIPPGGKALLDQSIGEYLAPGVHLIEGAEIMVLASAPYPAPPG
jgi:hypothetical protein